VNICARNILEWLLPTRCLLCGDRCPDLPNLCPGCVEDLPAVATPCPRCGASGPAHALCPACLRRPPPFARSVCPYRYAPPVSDLVRRLKYHEALAAAVPLGLLLARRVRADGAPLPAHVVPVPLHPRRLRQRGFNQSLEIARVASRALGVPLAPGLARRVRHAPPQSRLARPAERRRNVRGAFAAPRRVPPGSHIALVDDVVTTGSTAASLARTLAHAGAAEISVWAVARA